MSNRKNFIGLKNEFESAVENEPSVFESLSFYCSWPISLIGLDTLGRLSAIWDNVGKFRTYSNIMKILPPKTEKFQTKNSDIFHISAQNIHYGYLLEPPRRGGSNEYPQSMLLSRNKKNNVYPCKPQFYYIKVWFKGVKII